MVKSGACLAYSILFQQWRAKRRTFSLQVSIRTAEALLGTWVRAELAVCSNPWERRSGNCTVAPRKGAAQHRKQCSRRCTLSAGLPTGGHFGIEPRCSLAISLPPISVQVRAMAEACPGPAGVQNLATYATALTYTESAGTAATGAPSCVITH